MILAIGILCLCAAAALLLIELIISSRESGEDIENTESEFIMRVLTVCVEIHEKRNHPSEMGHRDARISYTVEVEEGEIPEIIANTWQLAARLQVDEELDRWIAEIKRNEEISEAKTNLGWIIQSAENLPLTDTDRKQWSKYAAALPDADRDEYVVKLIIAQASYREALVHRLDEYIADAESGKRLSGHEKRHFDDMLDQLDEDERDEYRKRLEVALAPKTEEAAQEENEITSGGRSAITNASNYQQQASRTLIDRPDFDISDTDIMIVWNALGLAGEAGEVADTVKKGIFHQHGLDREKMKKELGDVCWYLAALCTKLNLDLGEVMAANIDKLKVRYPDGYNSEDSVARVDTKHLARRTVSILTQRKG